jgi:multidrug efflux system outer membrane protein
MSFMPVEYDARQNTRAWVRAVSPGLLALLLLSGCASLLPPGATGTAVTVPLAWSGSGVAASTSPTSLAQWWQRFDVPLLVSLVDQSMRANTRVLVAQAALRQVRAQRDLAAAALSPTLGSSASVRRNPGAGGNGNTFQAGLDAGWELDVFGANRSVVDAGDAAAIASVASLGDVQVSIAAEVALSYITLRSAQQRLVIANANLASQADTLQITQWRVQAGLATSLESEQARAAVEQTRAQLPLLQTQIEQSHHALAVLTGQPPGALAAELASAAPVPRAPADIALAFPADTLRQRADVRAAELQARAALARVAQADARRLPDFRIGGSLGLSALTLGALTSGASFTSALLASVSLPIFDGGAIRAQVGVQQAALDQARAGYQAAVLTALQEVEDALVALRQDRARLVSLQNAADAANNAALLARQRYSSGLVDFQTVLDTQRTQLNAQDNVASATASVSADHVRLYKALGGGWSADSLGTLSQPASAIPPSPAS